jgi:hypothetical protein
MRVAACEAVPLVAATGAIATAAAETTYIQDLTGLLIYPTSMWMKSPGWHPPRLLHHLSPVGTLPRMALRIATVHRPLAPGLLIEHAVFANRA